MYDSMLQSPYILFPFPPEMHEVRPPAYIILHIHKTAGTSLRMMLRQMYPQKVLYENYDGFLTSPDEKTPVAKVFIGHNTWYGMHEVINRDAHYITFLRRPYERLVSLYYQHWLMMIAAHRPPLKFDDFFGFLQTTSMVRTLTHSPSYKNQTLENAKAILSKFKFIGLTETFVDDVTQLLPDRPIVMINKNEKKAEDMGYMLPRITEEQKQQLLGIIGDDQELYDYAVQLRKDGHNKNFRMY